MWGGVRLGLAGLVVWPAAVRPAAAGQVPALPPNVGFLWNCCPASIREGMQVQKGCITVQAVCHYESPKLSNKSTTR